MKKFLLSFFMVASALCANAQTSLFDAADIDSDGWLWFNTQAKIDKYVGLINEDDYKLDPSGKLIQLVYADQMPDYPAAVADPDMYGIGSDGYAFEEIVEEDKKGLDAIKGSIMLPASTGNMTYNGGGIALMLPSCVDISIIASSEASFYWRILASKENDAVFNDVNTGDKYVEHKWSNLKAYSMFNAPSAGQKTLSGIENFSNGYYDFTIKSDEPRYVFITHGRKYPIYIHAIKVTVKGDANSISAPEADAQSSVRIFNLNGQEITSATSGIVIMNGKKVLVK